MLPILKATLVSGADFHLPLFKWTLFPAFLVSHHDLWNVPCMSGATASGRVTSARDRNGAKIVWRNRTEQWYSTMSLWAFTAFQFYKIENPVSNSVRPEWVGLLLFRNIRATIIAQDSTTFPIINFFFFRFLTMLFNIKHKKNQI